jgi:hypothetical protein
MTTVPTVWTMTNAGTVRRSSPGRASAGGVVIERVMPRRIGRPARLAAELARARSRLRPDGGPSWAALKKQLGL